MHPMIQHHASSCNAMQCHATNCHVMQPYAMPTSLVFVAPCRVRCGALQFNVNLGRVTSHNFDDAAWHAARRREDALCLGRAPPPGLGRILHPGLVVGSPLEGALGLTDLRTNIGQASRTNGRRVKARHAKQPPGFQSEVPSSGRPLGEPYPTLRPRCRGSAASARPAGGRSW